MRLFVAMKASFSFIFWPGYAKNEKNVLPLRRNLSARPVRVHASMHAIEMSNEKETNSFHMLCSRVACNDSRREGTPKFTGI